jgi:virginiamycin B lyase
VATGAGSVWVTSNCDGTVKRVDPRTHEVVATIETGLFRKWLAVGRGHVWVGILDEPWDPEICN